MQKSFQIGRHTVLVTWKRVKNLSLRIRRETSEVLCSVPLRISEQQVWAFLKDREAWLDKHIAQIEESKRDKPDMEPTISQEEMCERLKTALPPLLEKWANYWGVSFNKVMLKEVKTYWGQCRPARGVIIFNIRLGDKPIELIEYIVAHELLHLLIPGHGKDFHAAMDRAMPDWKRRREMLKER